jgi:hypothetical protein
MKIFALPALRLFTLIPLSILTGLTHTGCEERAESPALRVEWPELTRFEAVLREAESLVATQKNMELLQMRTTLLKVGWSVTPASLPGKVHDMEKIRPLLGDLAAKLNALAVATLETRKMNELLAATRPILEELFEASGVPHP